MSRDLALLVGRLLLAALFIFSSPLVSRSLRVWIPSFFIASMLLYRSIRSMRPSRPMV